MDTDKVMRIVDDAFHEDACTPLEQILARIDASDELEQHEKDILHSVWEGCYTRTQFADALVAYTSAGGVRGAGSGGTG
jgi:hypothetical protein